MDNVQLSAYRSGTFSMSTARIANDAINTLPLRIGSSSTGITGVAADMEFTSALLFRRVLTPEEIRILTDYFTNRIK
jgi:hypothetical protein